MTNVPNTGDETNLTLYISMLGVTLIIMLGIAIHGFIGRKGKNKKEKESSEFSYVVSGEEKTTFLTVDQDKTDDESDNSIIHIKSENNDSSIINEEDE